MGKSLTCCVGGCYSTNRTHQLFCFPKTNGLRKLWLSFLVPTNTLLSEMTKEQLHSKRVCQKHFDRSQFDMEGKRLRYSYPCLFTELEIALGEPFAAAGQVDSQDHNYSKKEEVFPESSMIIEGPDFRDLLKQCPSSTNPIENASTALTETDPLADEKRSEILQDERCKSPNHIEMDPGVELPKTMEFEEYKSPIQIELDNNTDVEIPMILKDEKSKSPKLKVAIMKKLVKKKIKCASQIKNITARSLGDNSQRLAQAHNLLANKNIFENFKLLKKQAQKFLVMQLKQANQTKMARRFSLDEKLLALLLMKQSPKGYKLLENMFTLPNIRTLKRLSENITNEPGPNLQVLERLRKKIQNWDSKQKLCTIIFDEAALTPPLTFNENKDTSQGGGGRKRFCDHALVFMIRGICSPWRQSIAYYFCKGTISAHGLQNILEQLVSHVAQTGLVPLGVVCNQRSTFRIAMKNFRENTIQLRSIHGVIDDGSVVIAGYDLSIFFDPPHLLMGLRNNFLTTDIIWEKNTASWKDILFIYELDSKLGKTRALPKITAHHIDPKKTKRLKVSYAAQIFSSRTAAMLKYTNALRNLHSVQENTMATTADFVEFCDKLFDSVNGSPDEEGAEKGKLRKAVKKNSEHQLFWIEAVKKLKKMYFIDHDSILARVVGKARLVSTPSLQGWITTIESFSRLSALLFEKYNVDHFYSRYINQDPLENIFSRLKGLNNGNVRVKYV